MGSKRPMDEGRILKKQLLGIVYLLAIGMIR
jgi:hypothetical protein